MGSRVDLKEVSMNMAKLPWRALASRNAEENQAVCKDTGGKVCAIHTRQHQHGCLLHLPATPGFCQGTGRRTLPAQHSTDPATHLHSWMRDTGCDCTCILCVYEQLQCSLEPMKETCSPPASPILPQAPQTETSHWRWAWGLQETKKHISKRFTLRALKYQLSSEHKTILQLKSRHSTIFEGDQTSWSHSLKSGFYNPNCSVVCTEVFICRMSPHPAIPELLNVSIVIQHCSIAYESHEEKTHQK